MRKIHIAHSSIETIRVYQTGAALLKSLNNFESRALNLFPLFYTQSSRVKTMDEINERL